MTEDRLRRRKEYKPDLRKRLLGLVGLCTVLSILMATRSAYIQIYGDKRLAKLAERQFRSRVLIRPRRGLILDRNGESLAVNVETQSLAANPSKVQNRDTLARLLARVTQLPIKSIRSRLSSGKEFVWIQRHLPADYENQFKKWGLLDRHGELVDGLWLVKESKRVYPHGEVAANIIGDVNVDSAGIEGVELWKDSVMEGKVTSVSAVRDALGRPSFIDAVAARHVKNGDNVNLTLDASLQFAVEKELIESIRKTRARAGTVIVMNAVTGEILALANQPSFNPNEKRNYNPQLRRNRALTDGFEPGSTMKALLVASALEAGWNPRKSIWGGLGKIKVQDKVISEAESHEKFTWLTMKDVIRVSSNVGSARIALDLGAEKYVSTLRLLGFGQKTGSQFPGEISGWLPPPDKKVSPLTLANLGFGQGLLATPLQVTRAYAAFINGGWLVEPTFLMDEVKQRRKEGAQKVFSEKTVNYVLSSLEAVVSDKGTGAKAAVPGYRVAGKTGTAQVVDPATKKYSRSRYVASFVGTALDVEPRLVIFTALDGPSGIYYATETAAPLFSRVLQAAASRFGLPTAPEKQKNSQRVLADRSPSLQKDLMKLSQASPVRATSEGDSQWKMPDLNGLSPREVNRAFSGLPVRIKIKGFGVVQRQFPLAGSTLRPNDEVTVALESI